MLDEIVRELIAKIAANRLKGGCTTIGKMNQGTKSTGSYTK